MTDITKGIFWAGVILAVALFASANGIDKNASFALISGLTAAAWATMSGKGGRCFSARYAR